MSWRSVIALLLVAFIGGGAVVAWLASDGQMPWVVEPKSATVLPEEVEVPDTPAAAIALPAPTFIQPSASQAEAMLLVLNARRAVEAGKPLGDLGSRLQLTFGQSQPQALAMIANAARQPVSNAALLESFDAVAPQLAVPAGTLWDRARYEVNTLFVFHRSDAKPSALSAQVAKARALILSGDIAAAARTVRALPGAALANDWLAQANKGIAVRQALDMLDRSAAIPVAPPPAAPVPPTIPAPIQSDAPAVVE